MKQLVESFYAWYRNGLRHPKYRWLVILGTLTYLLSPIDISPDVFPIVGWIDDGILITLLIAEMTQLLREWGSPPEPAPASEEENGTVVDVQAKEVP